jgi:perosamine synthetase
MWIRKRLDISTKDLCYAFYSCFTLGSQNSITRKIENIWEKNGHKSLVCLSVRTGFDLLFQTLNFKPGSEILMSALTIPDMPKIVAHHGLVPVPVDLDIEGLAPSTEKIEAAITSKTKAIVIAHLFGGITNLTKISALAKKHDILVIEDCAQSYYSVTYTGSPAADISMFSFGTIKTATALGGGILIFRNNNLPVAEIHKIHHSYPYQSRRKFLVKTLKYILIILMSSYKIFPFLIKYLEKRGINYDAYIHSLSRSFPNGNLFDKIRRQPCVPLLKLMLHRFKTYEFTIIEKRIERGVFLANNLPVSFLFPGSKSTYQTYWAFPVLTSEPLKLIPALRKAGFDATHHSSLKIVGTFGNNTNCNIETSESILNQIVYLPLYPEMPMNEFKRMTRCLKEFEDAGYYETHTAEFIAVESFLESQVNMDILSGHNLIYDISLDSLGKISLIDFIWKSFGILFDEEQLVKFPSVGKMAEYIHNNKLFYKTDVESTWLDDLKDDSEVILPKTTFLYGLIVNLVFRISRLFFRFEGTGMVNIPESPCFIAPNHESMLDPFLILFYLDKQTLKNTFSYAKKEHARSWIRRYLASHANVIIMDLSKDLKNSILKMAQVVKQGKKILIFPEGTRTKNGEIGEFKKTYAILSTKLNIPIVPVVISGAYSAMNAGTKKINRGEKINIEFLPAVFPGQMNPDALNDLVKLNIIKAKK